MYDLLLLRKTGTFLAKGSVFAFLLINPVVAQQWQASMSSDDSVSSASTQKTVEHKAKPNRINFGKPAQNVQTKPIADTLDTEQSHKGKIQIYMKDFKISKNLSGIISCSMSLYVHSSLSAPISNLSFRLKWPTLEAPISFDNIPPQKAVFKAHAFAGKLCYSLDKAPNIIVNRCRAKGMSQQDCANRIEWVK